jgi:hypothetical protein
MKYKNIPFPFASLVLSLALSSCGGPSKSDVKDAVMAVRKSFAARPIIGGSSPAPDAATINVGDITRGDDDTYIAAFSVTQPVSGKVVTSGTTRARLKKVDGTWAIVGDAN